MTVGIKDGVHLGRRVLGEGRRRTRLTRSQNIEKMTDYREGRHASGETCETAGTHGRRRWCRDYARAIGALEGYLRAERDTGTFLDAAVLTRPVHSSPRSMSLRTSGAPAELARLAGVVGHCLLGSGVRSGEIS